MPLSSLWTAYRPLQLGLLGIGSPMVNGADSMILPHIAIPCLICIVPIERFIENAIVVVVSVVVVSVVVVSVVVVVRSTSPVP